MTQREKRIYLISYLLGESGEYRGIDIPKSDDEQKKLLRSLMNVRMPKPVSNEFLQIQNEYLQGEISEKGIADCRDFEFLKPGICLWQGDITALKCDAIVNAANSQMLGCFCPCHGCIDNAIHTFAGVSLRLKCAEIMKAQGAPEQVGRAKITRAYNLPSKYIIHTVGPMVRGKLRRADCDALAGCYRACLQTAAAYNLKSLAFCCVSTGEFGFPSEDAARIAIKEVRVFMTQKTSHERVIFNVFKDEDRKIYSRLLGSNK